VVLYHRSTVLKNIYIEEEEEEEKIKVAREVSYLPVFTLSPYPNQSKDQRINQGFSPLGSVTPTRIHHHR